MSLKNFIQKYWVFTDGDELRESAQKLREAAPPEVLEALVSGTELIKGDRRPGETGDLVWDHIDSFGQLLENARRDELLLAGENGELDDGEWLYRCGNGSYLLYSPYSFN